MKPIIGILAEVDEERATRIQNTYISAIENSGGIPLLLPYVESNDTIDEFIKLCDGFLFTGGADIEPCRYGEKTSPECGPIKLYRDELEFRILERAIKKDKPILAICRGIQLINVFFGGTLYQDIPTEFKTPILHKQIEDKNYPSHSVFAKEESPLYKLCGKSIITANSFHHQAIKKLGEGLSIMARAEDSIIEAVWSPSMRYLRAYQWHPERLYFTDECNKMIFDDFISNTALGK